MLNSQQQKYVYEKLYSSDHDYFFESVFRGEPFLEQDVLYFSDGETVSIDGCLLDKSSNSTSMLKKFSSIVESIKMQSPKFLNYYGPWELDFRKVLGGKFVQIYNMGPDPWDVDMFIDLTDPSVLDTRNARESIRRTKKGSYSLFIKKRFFLSVEHIELIRKLISRNAIKLCDASYFLSITSIMHNNVTTFFEAYFNEKLVGFLVVHEFFEQKPFLILVCCDTKYTGVSDALYLSMITHYMEYSAERIGLGYSTNQGIYQYKTKWGGVRCNDPFYQSIWARPDANPVYIKDMQGYLHWQSHLLLDKILTDVRIWSPPTY
jgi:hypothetical protein